MGFADGALRLLPGWLEFERLRLHPVAEHRPSARWCCCRCVYAVARRLPVRRDAGSPVTTASTTCSTGRATPRPAPGIGAWRITAYLVLFVRRRQRHHGDQAGPVDQRHHPVLPDRRCSSLPPLAFWVTKRICLALQRRDRDTGAARPRDRHASSAPPTASSSSGTSRCSRARAVDAGAARGAHAAAARSTRRGASRARSVCAPRSRTSTSPTRRPRDTGRAGRRAPRRRRTRGDRAWTGLGWQLHGGAEERPETDAYAPHEPESRARGGSGSADPEPPPAAAGSAAHSSASRADRPCSSPRSSSTFVREVRPMWALARLTSARRSPKALATAFRTASVAAPSTACWATRTIRTAA